MNRSLVVFTLFFGLLAFANNTQADEGHDNTSTNTNSNTMESLEKAPENSPWDPRNQQKRPSDDSEQSEAAADE